MERLAFALLCLFVGVVPFEGVLTVEPVGTLSRVVGVLAFGAAFVCLLKRGRLRRPSWFLVLAAAFFVWGLLSYWWSLAPEIVVDRLKTQAQLLLMVWIVWELVQERSKLLTLMQCYVAGSALTSALVVRSWLAGESLGATLFDRFTAYGKDANEIGFVIALAVPMAWYLSLVRNRRWNVVLNRAFVAVAVVAVLLTGSRTAFLSLCAGLLLIPISYRHVPMRRKVLLTLTLLLLVTPLFVWEAPTSVDRIMTLDDEVASFVGGRAQEDTRIRIWKSGLERFRERPLLGVGLGSYASAVATDALGHSAAPHNSFVAILVEQGVVGFLIFLTLLASLARVAWRVGGLGRGLFVLLLLSWSIGVFFMQQDYKKHSWIVFGLTAVSETCLRARDQRREKRASLELARV